MWIFLHSLQRCWGGLYPAPVIPADKCFHWCHLDLFVFASRCSCVIFLYSCGALHDKTNKINCRSPFPRGSQGHSSQLFLHIHQKQCQLWEPVRFPFPPGRWEPWLRCSLLLAFEVFPLSSIMLSNQIWRFILRISRLGGLVPNGSTLFQLEPHIP